MDKNFIENQVAKIREQVGDKKVLLGLSGGVDSSVCAALIHKAIGSNLISVFVDHGLLRKGEFEQVQKVFRDQFPADQEEDYIAINAYTTNIISAGKTMIESMKNFTDLKCLTDENRSSYSAMVSKIYDTVFSYKLLIRLRDYAQHGHLPVNSSENIYYFDLINILGKPHFNHNKAVKEQMIQAIATCADLFKDTPRLSLTKSLAEFVAATFRIYRNFWMFAEYAVLNAKEKIKDIVATYPEKMFVQFKEEAEKISDQYIQAWHELIKDAQLIRFLDKDHIKIVPYDQHI